MKKSSPCPSPSGWCSLGGEGEDHPADDEVEEEDGVHDERLAVGGLAVCQERRGCCGDTNTWSRSSRTLRDPTAWQPTTVGICTAMVLKKKPLLKPTGCNHQVKLPLSYNDKS